MAAAPSLSRTSSAVGKFEARLVNGRVGMRRSLLFVAVAAGLGYLVLSHFISLDTVLPGYFPSSSFSSSLSSSPRSKGSPSATTDAALALRPPDEYLDPPRIRLELQNPVYNVRVMRSILQHSNTSWQGKPDEAKGYFIQSLIWMQVVRPCRRHLAQRTCLLTAVLWINRLTDCGQTSRETRWTPDADFRTRRARQRRSTIPSLPVTSTHGLFIQTTGKSVTTSPSTSSANCPKPCRRHRTRSGS